MSHVRTVRVLRLLAWGMVLAAVVALFAAPALASAATIHGTVTDATGPLEHVTVRVQNVATWVGIPQVTGPDGKFSITVGTGTYLVRFEDDYDIHATMYWPDATYVQAYDPQPPTIELTAADSEADASVVMQEGIASIHVDVLRADGTTPVPNISVLPSRKATPPYTSDISFEGAISDADGHCNFLNLPAGQYYVWGSDTNGGAPQRLYLDTRNPLSGGSSVGPGASGSFTLTMKRLPFIAPTTSLGTWGELGWRKSGPDGLPITVTRSSGDFDLSASCGIYSFGGDTSYLWTDESLVTTFTGEGRHTLSALARLTPTMTGAPTPGSEPTVTLTIGIDNTAPVSTGNADGGNHPFVMSADDVSTGVPHSDVAHMYYSDDGVAVEYAGPVTLPVGLHTVSYWAVDGAGNVEPAHTGTIISGPQPGVSKPSGSSSVRKNRTATYRGTLTKRVKNHTHLQLQAFQWDGAQWILKRTKTVDVHTPKHGKPRYSGSIKFTSKGSWKVVAYYKGGGGWAPAWSSGRSVKVK
jgi:hypothetical protein